MSQPAGKVLHRICPTCDVEVTDDVAACPTCGTKLVQIRSSMDDVIGTVIDGRFEVRSLLGEGGMGTVFRAWQRSVGREVAIKLIDRSFSRDPMAVRRFLREARLASQLSQPNTVSVFDFGQAEDGRLFIAMELIRGRTLHEVLTIDGTFSIERAVRIGVQICDALDAAHGLSIIHRDLKLENIIILDHPPGRDLLKVLDFGLAKIVGDSAASRGTESGIVVGTPRYMAPEVATGGSAVPAGDLYAVGVILAELTVGGNLWEPDMSLGALVAQKLDPEPVVRRVPAPLRGLIGALLDPDPANRPSAVTTRTMLGAIRVDAPAPGSASSPQEPAITVRIKSSERRPPVTPDASTVAAPVVVTPSPNARAVARAESDLATTRSSPAAIAAPISTASLPPARPPRRAMLVGGLAGIVVIAIAAVALRGGRSASPSPSAPAPTTAAASSPTMTTTTTTTPTPTLPSPSPSPPGSAATPATEVRVSDLPLLGMLDDAAAPTADLVTLELRSRPAGAIVRSADRVLGVTPVTVQVPRSTAEHVYSAQLAGRRAATLKLAPDHDRTLTFVLPAQPASDDTVPF